MVVSEDNSKGSVGTEGNTDTKQPTVDKDKTETTTIIGSKENAFTAVRKDTELQSVERRRETNRMIQLM